LSASLIEMKTVPASGRCVPAPSCALRKARGKVRSQPMTSPVERISGPRSVSTPGKRAKGSTASFTENHGWRKSASVIGSPGMIGVSSSTGGFLGHGEVESFSPAMSRAAMEAMALSVALATKGTVREARGFTSIR
jgi:hypothetical protein